MANEIPPHEHYLAGSVQEVDGALTIELPEVEHEDEVPGFQARLCALKIENQVAGRNVHIEVELSSDGSTPGQPGALQTSKVVRHREYLVGNETRYTGAWLFVAANGEAKIRAKYDGDTDWACEQTLNVRASANILRIKGEDGVPRLQPVSRAGSIYCYNGWIRFSNRTTRTYEAHAGTVDVTIAAGDPDNPRFTAMEVGEATELRVSGGTDVDETFDIARVDENVVALQEIDDVVATSPWAVTPDEKGLVIVWNQTSQPVSIWREEGRGVWDEASKTWTAPTDGSAVRLEAGERGKLHFSGLCESDACIDPRTQWALHWERQGDPKVLVKRRTGLVNPSGEVPE